MQITLSGQIDIILKQACFEIDLVLNKQLQTSHLTKLIYLEKIKSFRIPQFVSAEALSMNILCLKAYW